MPLVKSNYYEYLYAIGAEEGEFMEITIGRYSKAEKSMKWFSRPHTVSDGVGALCARLERDNIPVPEQPRMKSIKRPSFFRRFLLLHRYLKFLKIKQHPDIYPWKQIDENRKGFGAGMGVVLFSRKETESFQAYCHEQDVTITSLLLHTLNKVTVDYLLKAPREGSWLLPVNMRGGVTSRDESGNFTSSIKILVPTDATLRYVHERILYLYEIGAHWGAWIFNHWLGYRSKAFHRKFFTQGRKYLKKKNKTSYIGSCSNLGKWDPASREGYGSDNYRYIIAGPVSAHCPVVATMISWRGQLGITFQVHPSLCNNLSDTEDLLRIWVEKLRESAACPAPAPDDDKSLVYVEPREIFLSSLERY